MAIKHVVIKPVRHAGVASQDSIYISGGAIVEGAPVIIDSGTGKLVELTDLDDGGGLLATAKIVGVALNATTAANQDCMVAKALPGRRFVASLTDLTAAAASDGGTKAIALTDIGTRREFHKDDTTLKWVLGVASATVGTNAAPLIDRLVDKVGATTNDTPSFGEVGRGVGSITPTPPNATWDQDPTAGPNFGTARVEFIFPVADTIYG